MTSQKIFFSGNLKFLRERKKISQEALAGKLHITRSKLNALESGQTKAPQPEDYLAISDYFRISIDSLLKVDLAKLGELHLRELEAGNDVYLKGSNLRVLAITVDKSNQENVEYVPVKAKAGYAAGYNDPEFIAALPRYHLPNLPKNKTLRIFPTTGDSMLPFPEGTDIIAEYVQDWTTLGPGTPCIVLLKSQGQDLLFKLLTYQRKENSFLLRSLNDLYAPYTVPAEETLEIWKYHSHHTRQLPEATPLNQVMTVLAEMQKEIRKLKKG